MKGVILTPIMAAILADLVFHSVTAGVVAFFAVLAFAVVVLARIAAGQKRR